MGYSELVLLLGLLLVGPMTADARVLLKKGKIRARSVAFLQEQLPLSVLLTTPSSISADGELDNPVFVSDRQAITVVFSRPVIALGSDFAAALPKKKLPFTLTCPVPGRWRWVTTSIVRWDPEVNWPTDVSCTFKWNTKLTSWDGARLALGELPVTRQLRSPQLYFNLQWVDSNQTATLTDGQWDARSGLTDDILPEVPPDGKMGLGFNYPVHLGMLKSALKVVSTVGEAPVSFELGRCTTPAPWSTAQPAVGASTSLDHNDTCAVLWATSPLQANAQYTVMLPAGSRYAKLSGPLVQGVNATFGGLRRFRLPWIASDPPKWRPSLQYRRHNAWLVHGLSADTQLADLQAAVSLCKVETPADPKNSACTPVPITLAKMNRGALRITVPTLAEGTTYRFKAAAAANVKDGFGQPLEASSTEFTTSYVNFELTPPTLANLARLEAGVETLQQWPHALHSPAPLPEGVRERNTPYFYESVASWEVDTTDPKSMIKLLTVLQGNIDYNVRDLFGNPSSEVAVPEPYRTPGSGAGWTQLQLPLREQGAGPSRVRVVHVCCTPVEYPAPRKISNIVKVLLNTTLSLNVLQADDSFIAWATNSAAGGGVLPGVTVSWYTVAWDYSMGVVPQINLLTTCTTGASGTCGISSDGIDNSKGGVSLMAAARWGDQVAILPSSGWTYGSSPTAPYKVSLVVDRMVVKPGDSIKLTAFVQRVKADTLVPPASTYGIIEVPIGWGTTSNDGSAGGGDPLPGGPGDGATTGPGFPGEGKGRRMREQALAGPQLASTSAASSSVSAAASAAVDPVHPAAGFAEAGAAGGVSVAAQGASSAPWLNLAGVASTSTSTSAGGMGGISTTYPVHRLPHPGQPGFWGDAQHDVSAPAGPALSLYGAARDAFASAASAFERHAASGAVEPVPMEVTPMVGTQSVAGARRSQLAAAASAAASGSREAVSDLGAAGRDLLQLTEYDNLQQLYEYDNLLQLTEYDDTTAFAQATVVGGRPGGGGGGGGDTNTPPARYVVLLDGTTGTLHVEIPVPSDARLQSYPLVLRLPDPSAASATTPPDLNNPDSVADWQAAADVMVVVSDPRPPTAELKVEAPAWVLPDGVITVKMTAVSYIGTSVDGSPITLTWTNGRTSGTATVTTNLDGAAAFTLNLGALAPANRSAPYENGLSFTANWVGPTREVLSKSAYTKVTDGPWRAQVTTSYFNSLPGVKTAVSGMIYSNADDSVLRGVPMTITLKPSPTGSAACATVASCTTTSGAPFSASCQLALPCVGDFVLEGCGEVPNEGGGVVSVCGRMPMGINATSWESWRLNGHQAPSIMTQKGTYKVGDLVTVMVQSPWPAARMLLWWGNRRTSNTQVAASVPANTLYTFTIGPLTADALGGISINAILDVPRLTPQQLTWPEGARTSVLWDPLAPHTHHTSTSVWVEDDNRLGVAVSMVPGAGDTSSSVEDVDGQVVLAVEPGGTAQITVAVTGTGGSGPAPPGTEVTVYGVDKAWIDLVTYPLAAPHMDLVHRMYVNTGAFLSSTFGLMPGSVGTIFSTMARRLGLDPWLPAATGGSGPDLNDTEYLSLFSSFATIQPSRFCAGGFVNGNCWYYGGTSGGKWQDGDESMQGPPPMAPGRPGDGANADDESKRRPGGGETADRSSDGRTVRTVADFVVTPLFAHGLVGADGTASFTFEAPPNLGSFLVRAFAANGAKAQYGSAESRLVVRRTVSLTPSVPRFVRVGDAFEAGAIVSVSSASTITVTLQVLGSSPSPLSATGATTKTLTFAPGGGLQREVRFNFQAVALGNATLVITATDGAEGGASDGLELTIPVRGQQGDVWVATTFPLAGGSAAWQEGMELPTAVPGSGALSLIAGVGYLPAILAAYEALPAPYENDNQPDAYNALLWAMQPPLLWTYQQLPAPATAGDAEDGLAALTQLTRVPYGLMWSLPERYWGYMPERCDTSLNSYAIYLAKHYKPSLPGGTYGALCNAVLYDGEAALVPQWTRALGDTVVQDAVNSRNDQYYPGPYSDWHTLAWTRLALGGGFDMVGSFAGRRQMQLAAVIAEDLSLQALINAYNNATLRAGMGLETRVVLALVLLDMGGGNPAPSLVTAVVNTVTTRIRVQGRTAYIAADEGSQYPASSDEQALCLQLLSRAGVTNQLMAKLAAYVATPPSVAGGYGGPMLVFDSSYRAQGLIGVALSAYDDSRGSSKPNLQLAAQANGMGVLQASFVVGGNLAPVRNSTAWEDLPPAPVAGQPGQLDFQAVGSGEATVSASLHFVPSALLPFPTYRGMYVEAAVQMIDPLTNEPTGPRVASVPLGSMVGITVQLTTPDDLGAVTLSVMMPGGLEPQDPNLAGGWYICPMGSILGGGMFRNWWWPMCPAQETRPDLVTYSYMHLSAGTSTVLIRAVAATAGTFVFPPVRASADAQPELMGMTAAGSLTVCADCTQATPGAVPPAPKPCPEDCSGNGMCDLATGSCVCIEGFTGVTCSTVSARRL